MKREAELNIVARRYKGQGIAELSRYLHQQAQDLYESTTDGAERERLASLQFHLKRAAEIAQHAVVGKTRRELLTLLEASVAGIEEKDLAGAMASATETEKAHAVSSNVSPFSTVNNNSKQRGE